MFDPPPLHSVALDVHIIYHPMKTFDPLLTQVTPALAESVRLTTQE